MTRWTATVRVNDEIVSRTTIPRTLESIRLDTGAERSITFDVHPIRRDDDAREWVVLHAADHPNQRVARLVFTTKLTGTDDAEVTPPHTLEIPASETEPMLSVRISVEEAN